MLPAPAAALVRMPTAIERPSATMKVIAAHEIAIWWAARGTAPSQPIMTVAIANAPPSKRSAPDAGRPTEASASAAPKRRVPASAGATQPASLDPSAAR